jgi:hypothetical protein
MTRGNVERRWPAPALPNGPRVLSLDFSAGPTPLHLAHSVRILEALENHGGARDGQRPGPFVSQAGGAAVGRLLDSFSLGGWREVSAVASMKECRSALSASLCVVGSPCGAPA